MPTDAPFFMWATNMLVYTHFNVAGRVRVNTSKSREGRAPRSPMPKTAAFTALAAFQGGMQSNLLDSRTLGNQNRVKKPNLHPGVTP